MSESVSDEDDDDEDNDDEEEDGDVHVGYECLSVQSQRHL